MSAFSDQQKTLFETELGAGSEVTNTEFIDSQITLDAAEQEVLFSFVDKEELPRGKEAADKIGFRLFNTDQEVALRVNLPKEDKEEVRIYLSKAEGFKPSAGEIWFLYKDRESGGLVIGALNQESWNLTINDAASNPNPSLEDEPTIDDLDETYQLLIYKKESEEKFARNTKVALEALEKANFTCEIDPSHTTFIGKFGTPYVEAHHLIPFSQQDHDRNVDVVENIVALCPVCHRRVHFAEPQTRLSTLELIYNKRAKKLREAGLDITLAKLAAMYKIL